MIKINHPELNIHGATDPKTDRVLGWSWSLPSEIEDWLNEHCPDAWRVDVKERALVFDDNKDALRFKILWT